MDCYVLLNGVFNARMKHRKYAYVPEFFDDGHDYQFTRITNLIDECENILTELYVLKDSDSSSEDEIVESLEQQLIINDRLQLSKRAKEYREFRLQRNDEIEEWIDKYIDENKEILDRRELLGDNITICVLKLFEDYDPDNDIHTFVKVVALFNLVGNLRRLGYFLKDYKPERCENPGCKCFIHHKAKLGCPCIRNNNTLEKYYNLSSEESLKIFFGTLLLNKSKILPLVEDIMDLYYLHDESMVYMKLLLCWDETQERLVLEEDEDDFKPQQKASGVFAAQRLKNKYYQQKITNALLCHK